jgi:hypothetical protein
MVVAVHPVSGAIGSYFQLNAGAGRSARAGTLELRNLGGTRLTVLLDPVDAVTASTLGSAYAVRGLAIHRPARWTALARRSVVLTPHGTSFVEVGVRVPARARAGDYLSGISVQAAAGARQTKLRGNVSISSIQRYAVGVLVRLPGPRFPLLQLTGASIDRQPAGVAFSLFGRNPGNVILQNVAGTVRITQGKRAVAQMPLGPGTFVTGTSIAYPIPVPREHPREGTVYRVRAVLRYAGRTARLDRLVRFGHLSALRQEAFGGPKARASGGGPSAPLLAGIGGALVAVAAGTGLGWRRLRVGPRSPRGGIERALVAARTRAEPLSLIVISATGVPARKLRTAVRSRLRRSDRLYPMTDGELLVVASDTAPAAADVLAGELQRAVERAPGASGAAVTRVLSAEDGTSAADLLERAQQPDPPAQSVTPSP